jgi:kinetochore protein Mis12/MTW1
LDLPLPSSAPTPASIQALREQLRASESLSIALEAEAAATENMLTQITNLVATSGSQDPATSGRTNDQSGSPLSFLMSSHSSSTAPAPVTENAAFAASQLPALRALLTSIRPAIAELRPTAKPSSHAPADTDTERIARRAYVDAEVQRAVRGAVGLVSDDGENADLQRGIAQSDVLALEAAMAARKKGQP